MGLLNWLFSSGGKSHAEEKADQISEKMGKSFGWGRPLNAKEIYNLAVSAYNYGYHAEHNPFPYGTWQFRTWENGFEDQIYLEQGLEGLDRYNDGH